jgi:hypothetical protein
MDTTPQDERRVSNLLLFGGTKWMDSIPHAPRSRLVEVVMLLVLLRGQSPLVRIEAYSQSSGLAYS